MKKVTHPNYGPTAVLSMLMQRQCPVKSLANPPQPMDPGFAQDNMHALRV